MERLLHWAVENSDAQGLEESRKNIQNLVIEIKSILIYLTSFFRTLKLLT